MCYRTENIRLQARPFVTQPGNFTGWGGEGVKDVHMPSDGTCFTSLFISWARLALCADGMTREEMGRDSV